MQVLRTINIMLVSAENLTWTLVALVANAFDDIVASVALYSWMDWLVLYSIQCQHTERRRATT